MINSMKKTIFVLAVGVSSMMMAAGAIADEPLGYCGEGHQLYFSLELEAFLAGNQQDNVNFDGYVCINTAASDHGNRGFIVITDNNRQSPQD